MTCHSFKIGFALLFPTNAVTFFYVSYPFYSKNKINLIGHALRSSVILLLLCKHFPSTHSYIHTKWHSTEKTYLSTSGTHIFFGKCLHSISKHYLYALNSWHALYFSPKHTYTHRDRHAILLHKSINNRVNNNIKHTFAVRWL